MVHLYPVIHTRNAHLVDLLLPGLEEQRHGLVIQIALMVLILGRHCVMGIDPGEQLPI